MPPHIYFAFFHGGLGGLHSSMGMRPSIESLIIHPQIPDSVLLRSMLPILPFHSDCIWLLGIDFVKIQAIARWKKPTTVEEIRKQMLNIP